MTLFGLQDVQSVRIDRGVVTDTLLTLREFGSNDLEGLVLWLGSVNETEAHVSELMVPEQRSVKSEEGLGYFVSGETLFAVNKTLSERRLRLIAQVHSHPGEAYHSEADDRYAIVTVEGGLSIVVPDFGEAPEDPGEWAVYRLDRGYWRELKANEAKALFRVV